MSDQNPTTSVEFRSIPEAPGYRFGSDGSIESQWGMGRSAKPDYPWHPLAFKMPGKRGYLRINLKISGVPRTVYVHTMICWAFRGPCPEGCECRHLDGDRMNNNITNLVWGTPTENVADQFRHGTFAVGERRNSAKLTEEQVREIRRLHATGEYGYNELARMYGVYHHGIRMLVLRKTWKHVV